MKDLLFLLKKTTRANIAKQLKINRCNITMWLLIKRIPKKRLAELKKLRGEYVQKKR